MRCPPEWGVKQYVAMVRNRRGRKFMVFTTGSAKHYLFQPLDRHGCAISGTGFPVEKKRLKDDLRRALAHGYGNADIYDPPLCMQAAVDFEWL